MSTVATAPRRRTDPRPPGPPPRQPERVRAAVLNWMLAPAHPINLGVTRAVVFALTFLLAWSKGDVRYAALPEPLLFPTPGVELVPARLLLWPELMTAAKVVMLVACVTGMVGLLSRTSAAITLLTGVYVLGVPQQFGKVNHYHHLLWFVAILAVSRSGDALSLDALRRRRGRQRPDRHYGVALKAIWLLIGVVYLFPGLTKLYVSGLDWASSDNMIHQLQHLWWEGGRVVAPFRVDEAPLVLLQSFGVFTLVFEVGFIVAILFRRTRPLALLAGVAFHLGTLIFTGINFWYLWPCYVAFVDWAPRDQPGADEARRRRRLPIAPVVGVALVLLTSTCLAGLLQVRSGWPIAAYPGFAGLQTPTKEALSVTLVAADGSETTLDQQEATIPWLSSARARDMVRQLLNVQDPAERERRLSAYWSAVVDERPALAGAAQVRFNEDIVLVDPDRWDHPPLSSRLLMTLNLTR